MSRVSRFPIAVLLVTGAAWPSADGLQDTQRLVYLEGHVIDARTNQPARGVVVLARGVQGATTDIAAAFLTGPDGRFVFRDLPAGTMGLRATKTGFLPAEIKSFDASPGLRREDLRLSLRPESTISGRVVDQFGEPLAGASVKVVRHAAVPPNEPSNLLPGTTARTDDDGRYLFGKLDKDLYLVFVEGSASRAPRAHDPVFYPDSLTADRATVIDLDAATERTGVDMMVTVTPATSSGPINKLLFNDTNPAFVSGTVRDRDGRGVSYVTVGLRLPSPSSLLLRTVTADEAGRFEIDRLPRGKFELVTTRDSAVRDGSVASALPVAASIELAPDQRLTDVVLKYTSSGAIAGRLRDQFGDALEGTVSLRPKGSSSSASYSTPTNFRGEFRFSNLQPNNYVLVVEERSYGRDLRVATGPDTERTMAFLPIYYPGVAEEALATTITVTSGGDLSGLDVEVRPEPVTTIDVTIDAGDRRVESVRLTRSSPDRRVGQLPRGTVAPSGSQGFFPGVTAGRHFLVASAMEKTEDNRLRLLVGRAEVTSDGATPMAVKITLEPTATLRAQVVLDGPSAPDRTVSPFLIPADGSSGVGPISFFALRSSPNRATGMFEGISAGRYWIDATTGGSPAESKDVWTIRSVMIGGRVLDNRLLDIAAGEDVNDIVITMGDQPTEISGAVTATRTAVPPRSVILFATESRFWYPITNRVRVATVGPDGRYTFKAVNPGDYRLAPMTSASLPTADWTTWLNKLLPLSTPVSIKFGDRRTVDLIAR